MATTTNYGWTTPDDTDLVKNGADAIRDLGSAIDTSMNTALGTKKAGLVLLNTTSFSAVSSQSINDVFSATYKNYLVQFVGTQSTSAGFTMRLRVSGADNTNSTYNNAGVTYLSNNSTTTLGAENATSFNLSGGFTRTGNYNFDFFEPFSPVFVTRSSSRAAALEVPPPETVPLSSIKRHLSPRSFHVSARRSHRRLDEGAALCSACRR